MSSRVFALSSALLLIAPLSALAAPIHDESMDGDLSGDRLNPTARILSVGSNTVSGMVVAGEIDYLRLSLPAGLELSSIVLDTYDSTSAVSFIAVQEGTTFTVPSTTLSPDELLGWTHFGNQFDDVGTDILPDIAMGFGAIGFTPPLTANDYTFWIQETGPAPVSYGFDFVVTPEPASALLLGSALAGLAATRRARRRR